MKINRRDWFFAAFASVAAFFGYKSVSWRELSKAEIINERILRVNGLKGSQLMHDYDILTKWMKYNGAEAKVIMERTKKLNELKLQVFTQNPSLIRLKA